MRVTGCPRMCDEDVTFGSDGVWLLYYIVPQVRDQMGPIFVFQAPAAHFSAHQFLRAAVKSCSTIMSICVHRKLSNSLQSSVSFSNFKSI